MLNELNKSYDSSTKRRSKMSFEACTFHSYDLWALTSFEVNLSIRSLSWVSRAVLIIRTILELSVARSISKKCYAYENIRENLDIKSWKECWRRARMNFASEINSSYDYIKQMSFAFFSSSDFFAALCRFHLHLNLLELYVSFVRFFIFVIRVERVSIESNRI